MDKDKVIQLLEEEAEKAKEFGIPQYVLGVQQSIKIIEGVDE